MSEHKLSHQDMISLFRERGYITHGYVNINDLPAKSTMDLSDLFSYLLNDLRPFSPQTFNLSFDLPLNNGNVQLPVKLTFLTTSRQELAIKEVVRFWRDTRKSYRFNDPAELPHAQQLTKETIQYHQSLAPYIKDIIKSRLDDFAGLVTYQLLEHGYISRDIDWETYDLLTRRASRIIHRQSPIPNVLCLNLKKHFHDSHNPASHHSDKTVHYKLAIKFNWHQQISQNTSGIIDVHAKLNGSETNVPTPLGSEPPAAAHIHQRLRDDEQIRLTIRDIYNQPEYQQHPLSISLRELETAMFLRKQPTTDAPRLLEKLAQYKRSALDFKKESMAYGHPQIHSPDPRSTTLNKLQHMSLRAQPVFCRQ